MPILSHTLRDGVGAVQKPQNHRRWFSKTRTLFLWGCCVLWLGSSACYHIVGEPLQLRPGQMLTAALDAHHRGDNRAFRTLLARFIATQPESEEAAVARTLLLAIPPTDPRLLRE